MSGGSFLPVDGTFPGSCPEIDRQMRRIIRRIDFGNADGDLPGIRADVRRKFIGVAGGHPPENRRIQNPSLAKGFGFPCQKADGRSQIRQMILCNDCTVARAVSGKICFKWVTNKEAFCASHCRPVQARRWTETDPHNPAPHNRQPSVTAICQCG